MRRMFLGLVALTLAAGPAHAVTIDFDSLATGSYTEAQFDAMFGATFDNTTDGQFRVVSVVNNPLNPDFSAPNAVLNLGFSNAANTTMVTFAALVSSVSVTMGDFGGDADDLHLRAYNAANVLIGSDFFANPSSSSDGHTLSVATGGIQRIEFWGDGLDSGNNVFWDNLTWQPASVPEPSSMALLGIGLLLFGAARRRAGRQ